MQDQESLAWASTLSAAMPYQLAFALEPPKYAGPQGMCVNPHPLPDTVPPCLWPRVLSASWVSELHYLKLRRVLWGAMLPVSF